MKLKTAVKNKLSTRLISSLYILKHDIDSLYEKAEEISLNISGVEVIDKRYKTFSNLKTAITDKIETLSVYDKSFYDDLLNEIDSSKFFPTDKSKKVALEIVKNLDERGFFDGDIQEIADNLNIDVDFVEKIRQRFAYLSFSGVGAKNLKEALLFQLYNLEIDHELFDLIKKIILNLENIKQFREYDRFEEALKILKSFDFYASLDYESTIQIIPEIVILNRDNKLEVIVNDDIYPSLSINEELVSKDDLKYLRGFLDSIEFRKSTLKKIALMIVEFQYEFFLGGDIKPMKIEDIATELEYNPSTISRAISNKYLMCDRGTFELKNFFSFGFNEDISSIKIKEEIVNLIKNEDKTKPLNDNQIANYINKKYNLNLVRRTITKYRKFLGIPNSRERKNLIK